MSYTWTDGDLITAERLNNTGGSGVLICNSSYSSGVGGYVLDKTAQEIYDALLAGTPVYIKYQYGVLGESGQGDYEGTLYLAPVIKIYNYNYTATIRICASKPNYVNKGFAPAVLIYSADALDEYPVFLDTVFTPNSYVSTGGDIT